MVYSICKHNDIKDVSHLRFSDEAEGVEEMDQAGWNPFLYAVGQQKLDIVRYFLGVMKLPLNHVGTSNNNDETSGSREFCLKIAINSKNVEIFSELWSHHNNWDFSNLKLTFQYLKEAKWLQGIGVILTAYTTDVVFNSQTT